MTRRAPGGRSSGRVWRSMYWSIICWVCSPRASSSSGVRYRYVSPNWATRCHSSGSAWRVSSQRITSSKYRSAITELSRSAATASSGSSATSGRLVNMAVARHGRSRPLPPPASSTSPYLASWRRWKDMLAELSPSSSAARVAVSGPSTRSSPTSESRVGWARARSARGSRSRLTERFTGRPAAAGSSAMHPKIALQRVLGKRCDRYPKCSLHTRPFPAADRVLAESPHHRTRPERQSRREDRTRPDTDQACPPASAGRPTGPEGR